MLTSYILGRCVRSTGFGAHFVGLRKVDVVYLGHSVLGRYVGGGQYILGRNVRGTAFRRTKCPADNSQGGQNFLRHRCVAA